MGQTACIIGAGPAGLTAARELLKKTQVKPIVLEMSADIGGLSKTVEYKGNRIDIGGHRFFSKSQQIMQIWQDILPIESNANRPEEADDVMLVRNRLSRILFLRKFFSYPISLRFTTLTQLGLWRVFKIGCSYTYVKLFPIKPEVSLEDFFINRFGMELYRIFFQDYTKKVWGVSCKDIPRDWGAQRVKGISVGRVILHALKKLFFIDNSIQQKTTETSLIDRFIYPKFGPGQLWEKVAKQITQSGGDILLHHKVVGFQGEGQKISKVIAINTQTGEQVEFFVDYVFSSMPVKDFIHAFDAQTVPPNVSEVAAQLMYRDFITVGVLLKDMNVAELPDNWIYIQEKDVKVGRIQVFNNWSPYMVQNDGMIWLGLEYFVDEGDALWNSSDAELQRLAGEELQQIGFIKKTEDILDSVVIRVNKAYPAYFGSYCKFREVRNFTDQFVNLFLIGRNGMHRYNNMDHSMLTAIAAVDNIAAGVSLKENIWAINTDTAYHEGK